MHHTADKLVSPSPLLKMTARLCAKDLVTCAYLALLGREPDADGLQLYARQVATQGDLVAALRALAGSDEHWAHMVAPRTQTLLQGVARGLLGADAQAAQATQDDLLDEHRKRLEQTADLGPWAAALAATQEHWQRQVATRAQDIAGSAYLNLTGGLPDPDTLEDLRISLAADGDIGSAVAGMARTDAHWSWMLQQRSAELLALATRALVGSDAPEKAADTTAPTLRGPHDLQAFLQRLAVSDALWQRTLSARAPALLHRVAGGLVGAADHAVTLEEHLPSLLHDGDLGRVVARIAASDAHWNQVLQQRSSELLALATRALLGSGATAQTAGLAAAALRSPQDLEARLLQLADGDAAWQFKIKTRAPALVDMVCRAVLGRPADAGMVQTLAPGLVDVDSLGGLIAALAGSDEHWRMLLERRGPSVLDERLAANAQAMVDLVFQSLLGRPADADGLATYGRMVSSLDGLKQMLLSMAGCDELWRVQLERRGPGVLDERLAANAQAVVDLVFQSLLGRPADADGLATYGPMVTSLAGIKELLDSVGKSEEHHNLLHPPPDAQSIPHRASLVALPTVADHQDLADGERCPRWDPIAPIDRSFMRLVGRRADEVELKAVLQHGKPLGPLLRQARAAHLADLPDLPAITPTKVLLFGAYGNGNLGDAYQAMAMRHLLMQSLGLPSEAIFATCAMGDKFEFPAQQRLPSETIFDHATVNSFDALIVGGGGLLAHPHNPLMDSDWVEGLDLPVVLFAIGASSDNVGQHRALLGKAWAVSARDKPSLAAVRTLRPEAVMARDPILCAGSVASLQLTATAAPPRRRAAGLAAAHTLWVLKHPSSMNDEALLDAFAAYLADQPAAGHTLAAVEPHLDHALERWFPGRVEYLRSASDLNSRIRASARVVSMRLHGAIFAALGGRPSLGCSQHKIGRLYEECAVDGQYFDNPAELLACLSASTLPAPHASRRLTAARRRQAASLEVLVQALAATGCAAAGPV